MDRGEPVQTGGDQREESGAPDGGTTPSGYPDLSAILAAMSATANDHPAICQLVDLTATYGTPPTVDGRHLYAVKISDQVESEEDEPAFLMVSSYHCRELVTPVIALDAMDRLTDGYGTDPQITQLVNNYEVWIAPQWNPDGYDYVFNVDNFWRKNRLDNLDGSFGVDLNRNSPFGWSALCSGSTIPSSSTYKGPFAASEAETLTMLAFSEDQHFAKVLDYHSSGREVLWGYSCSAHPLAGFLQAEATALSFASGYGGSERSPSAEGEHYEWQLAEQGSFSFLTETALEFQPSYVSAVAEAATVWPGTLWMLERSISLSGHVTDACTNLPLSAAITVAGISYSNGEQNHSDGPFGRYHLFLPDGVYTVTFSAQGYASVDLRLTVAGSNATVADVALKPLVPGGCWSDLGFAKRGVAGDPLLSGTGTLLSGDPQHCDLSSAAPSSTATLVAALSTIFAPFKGGTLVPEPLIFLPLPTDALGSMTLPFTLPAGIPSGIKLYFQCWITDSGASHNLSASNALSATTGL